MTTDHAPRGHDCPGVTAPPEMIAELLALRAERHDILAREAVGLRATQLQRLSAWGDALPDLLASPDRLSSEADRAARAFHFAVAEQRPQ